MVDAMNWRVTLARWAFRAWLERQAMRVASHLPRWLVYWATIRLWAHGTTGRWGNTDPGQLSLFEAMDRWQQK
jgi:hypothetical protein